MNERKEEKHLPCAQESIPIPEEIARLGIEEYLCGGHGPLPIEDGESVQVHGEEIAILGLGALAKQEEDHLFGMWNSTMNDEGILEDFRNNPLPPIPFPESLFFDDEDFSGTKRGKSRQYFIERHNRKKNRRGKNQPKS